MKHGAFARSTAALVLPAACLAAWLTGCAAPPTRHVFDPQESLILEQPLSVIEPCVPRALESLGITLDSQEPSRGKLIFHATSASDLEVEVKLEAMTSKKTQLEVGVYGYSNFGDWLASEIAEAISNEVDRAMERAEQAGAESQR